MRTASDSVNPTGCSLEWSMGLPGHVLCPSRHDRHAILVSVGPMVCLAGRVGFVVSNAPLRYRVVYAILRTPIAQARPESVNVGSDSDFAQDRHQSFNLNATGRAEYETGSAVPVAHGAQDGESGW